MRRLLAFLSVLFLALNIASAQTSPPPTDLPAEPDDSFRVTEVLPSPGATEIDGTAVITVIFNRPVVPLGSIEEMDNLPSPISLDPAIEGTGEWLNTAIYTFQPNTSWGGGAKIAVTVNAGLQAMDGSVLAEDYSWSFTTALPQVVSVMPTNGEQNILLNRRFQMTFNMPVDQASVESAFFVRPENGEPLSGTFTWDEGGAGFMFTPTNSLIINTAYIAGFPEGAVRALGGDATIPEFSWRTTTIPYPAVTGTYPVNGDQSVEPYYGVTIYFASPMNLETLENRITIDPAPDYEVDYYFSDWDNSMQISFSLEASTEYAITLAAGAEDIYGNTIDTPFSFSFTTRPYSPSINLYVPGPVGFYNAYTPHTQLYLTHLNVSTLNLRLYNVPLSNFAAQVTNEEYYDPTENYATRDEELIKDWTVQSVALPNEYRYELLDFGTNTLNETSCGDTTPILALGDEGKIIAESIPTYASDSDPLSAEPVESLALDTPFIVVGGALCSADTRYWKVQLFNTDQYWIPETLNGESAVQVLLAGYTTTNVFREEFFNGDALKPGVYFLSASSPETDRLDYWPLRHFLVVGTANITLKVSLDSATVWATDIATGAPLANVPITLYENVTSGSTVGSGLLGNDLPEGIASGVTDSDGIARIALPRTSNLNVNRMAVLDDGTNFGIGLSSWSNGIEGWYFGIETTYYPQQYKVYMYTDRPIYRPEQPVYFRGVVRNKDDVTYTPPNLETVPIVIYDDRGEVIYERELPLTEFGTFSDTFQLGPEAPLGFYRIELQLPSNDPYGYEGGSVYFNVAEYRLPEFQVETTPIEEEVAQGDTVCVQVDSSYFFGGRVSDALVEYNVIARPYFFSVDLPGNAFSFTDYNPDGGPGEYYGSSAGRVADGEGVTDQQGSFIIEVPADLENATQSQVFTVEAVVTDESAQAVAGRAEVIVHQGEIYVGVRPTEYVSTAGEETSLDFITVDWDGNPIEGKTVNVEIIERRWSSVQEQDPDGRTIWSWEMEEIPVESAEVTTGADGMAHDTFTPPNGGIFKIIVVSSDDAGNEIRASDTIWVSSGEYVAWRQQNSNRIDLIASATEFEIGDTAEILITSPFQGTAEALITVERGDVYTVKHVTMESNSYVFEYPITTDDAPNVFVSVLLVKGTDENNPVPAFRMGMIGLSVDNEQKEITIDVTRDVEIAGPGDTVNYTVRTTDYAGNPVQAEVGVGLTDLAALSIAAPNSPEIMDVFYGPQALVVRTSTPLTINTDQLTQEILDTVKGGGGGFGEGGIFDIREEFVDTAYWEAHLITGKDGTATFSVTLPDNLTTWRLDARAVTSGEDGLTLVGMDTFDLLSTKPLLIRPVTPRFFTVGDQTTLVAIVNNNTEEAQNVEVAVDASGVTFIAETASQTVDIPAGGRARVEWLVIVDNVETIDLTFFARSTDDRYTDASKPPLGQGEDNLLPVYRYEVPETTGTGGVIREPEIRVEGVSVPANVTQGDLTVSVEPSLAATMFTGIRAIRNYKYDNIEWTISILLPNVMAYRAIDAAGYADEVLRTKIQTEVEIALQRLVARQKIDGGWGWSLRDESDPLVTSYALIGLTAARDAGFTVDPALVERAQRFVQNNLSTITMETSNWRADRQAFLVYALAYSGAPDVARTTNLFDERERLSLYAKALVARSLHLIGNNEERVETLISDLMNAAIVSANGTHWEEGRRDYWNWNTDTRTTAIALGTLVQLRPESDLIPNAVRYLMVSRTADAWETTQETAWALMAFSDFMQATGELNAEYAWDVALNGESVGAGLAQTSNITERTQIVLDVAELLTGQVNELSLTHEEGPGNLYYTAYLRNFLPVPEIEAVNEGIIVQRRYTLLDDANQEAITTANVGDIVQVRLTIIAPNTLHYVTIEDPIPAGVEPIDPNLLTSQQVGTRPGLDNSNPLSYGWGWWWFSNIEFRDEKIVLTSTYLPAGTYEYVYTFRAGLEGVYNVIPPIGYETYFPEVYGRGDGTTFTVLSAE